MFKVGDKVRIKDEIGFEETSILDIEELKKKVLTVESVGAIRWDDSCGIDICGVNWAFNSNWLELVGNEELDKFEAFLREIVSGISPNYTDTRHNVKNLMGLSPWDEEAKDDENRLVDALVSFYKTFEPQPQVRKLTMTELRDIIGEDFEIVED